MDKVLRFSVLLVFFLGLTFAGMAQKGCGINDIRVAQSRYDIGKFDECINALKPCVNKRKGGFEEQDKIMALKYLAMSYLAMESYDSADKYIRLMLYINDDYEAESGDPDRMKDELVFVKARLRESMTSSVSKKMEDMDLAPATIQVITAQDIIDRGYNNIEDIFNDLPGFNVTNTYGVSSSAIYQRGFRTAQLTDHTLILVDGMEDNDISSQGAFISNQYPLSNIKKIEVIYGPASTIYGADAFTGVINIITKDEQSTFNDNDTRKKAPAENTKVALDMQTGLASYNTRYVDGTMGVKRKGFFFSLTGRAYLSDRPELSSYPNANNNSLYYSALTMDSSANTQALTGQYFKDSSGKVVPTAAGIYRADSIDKAAFKNSSFYKNGGVKVKAPLTDFDISAKMSFSHFTFGFQYWNRTEDPAADYTYYSLVPYPAYSNWQIREYRVYAQYDKHLSSKLSLSSLTYYRYSDYGDNSRLTFINDFLNGNIAASTLLNPTVTPFDATTNFAQYDNEFNSELKLFYKATDRFDVLAGFNFRTRIMMANYLASATSPAAVYGSVVDSPGGNSYTSYIASSYATVSYKLTQDLNLDAGGRLDNIKFKEVYGYDVFNPRLDAVYHPGRVIIKAIYSEAFMDASNQQKFSTSAARLLNDPGLTPEKIRNIELNGRYKLNTAGNSYVELAAFQSFVTNSITLQDTSFMSGGAEVTTQQFQNGGEVNIRGLQGAANIAVAKGIAIYANATYTHSFTTFTSASGGDSLMVRTGDIAYFSANAGINALLLKGKLNVNLRTNIVSDKPTGATTSINTNPLNSIPGYYLLNATIGYRIVKGMIIQVGCNNIMNTTFYSPGSHSADGITYAQSVQQPLRNYSIKLILNY